MTIEGAARSPGVRCAAWSRESGESALGTAVAADRFVLVELPLPWPADIAEHPLLAEMLRDAPTGGAKVRVLALRCEQGCGEDHQVICYWRDPAEPFAGYRRCEGSVDRSGLAEAVRGFVSGEGLTAEPCADVHDLLLCTHGSRDRCCAKLGGRLYEDLRGHTPESLRVWRTSHTGGHRFAPTGLTFPDGFAWAALDAEVATAMVTRSLPVERALAHLRGCAAMKSGLLQVADAQGFAQHGWQWTQIPRLANIVEDDGAVASVRVEFAADEVAGEITATVERGRTLPIAACGEPIEAASKQTTELLLRAVD